MTEKIKHTLSNLRRVLEKSQSDHGIISLLEQVEALAEHVDALETRIYALETAHVGTP